ncbi:MAG TPA: hypothetical protein VHN77_01720 [Phycisphaerales bacterium]|nr:hypothetical protein [Phycisphaerales bacterium]
MGEPRPTEERLQRLEETLGFTEHEQEQLGQQVLRLQQQVQTLTQRLVQLETAIEIAGKGRAKSEDQE